MFGFVGSNQVGKKSNENSCEYKNQTQHPNGVFFKLPESSTLQKMPDFTHKQMSLELSFCQKNESVKTSKKKVSNNMKYGGGVQFLES